MEKKAIRVAYGEALAKLGSINKDIVVLDADLSHSTMTAFFKSSFPDRFFNVGIAEQNLMDIAAGFAIAGKIPFASTFAIFGTGRAYDQIRNSIAYANLNVKIALTHAGISVGEDGGSHQSIEDIALMRVIPGMTIVSPCDALEVEKAVFELAKMNGPAYLRMGRLSSAIITDEKSIFEIGKANIMREGNDICLFATGILVEEALLLSDMLNKDGISSSVVNIHTIKPIDEDIIIKMAKKHSKLVSIEEHSIIGGLGGAISEVLTDKYPKSLLRIGINDEFGQSGKGGELLEHYGLTAPEMYKRIKLSF